MSKNEFPIPIFFGLLLLITSGCRRNSPIPGLRPDEILLVTLALEDTMVISKVVLQSNHGRDSITGNAISKHPLTLKIPHKGEGTFFLCVYTPTDTLCSTEMYVEGGYRPKLRLKNKRFETEEAF